MLRAPWRRSPSATASMIAGRDSMPILTAANSMSSNTASICARDELGRHVVDRAHRAGVLRGQRGDHRGAVRAERREGLEVGLDAGAAAGIRAGYGQHVGDQSALSTSALAASIAARSSRLAASGSAAAMIARDHRDAVGAGAHRGARRCAHRCRRSRPRAGRSACASAAEPFGPDRTARIRLGRGGGERPVGDVVDLRRVDRTRPARVIQRDAEDRVRPEDRARRRGRQVALADVAAERPRRARRRPDR